MKIKLIFLLLAIMLIGCSDNSIFPSSKIIKEMKKEINDLRAKVNAIQHAQNIINAKLQYELQERCAKCAAESFKTAYGKESMLRHYTNHYNNKLNKCFILVTEIILPDKKDPKSHYGLSKLLYDVNEHKEYASFYEFTDIHKNMYCKVLDKLCSSEAEWDNLVKPYMEE